MATEKRNRKKEGAKEPNGRLSKATGRKGAAIAMEERCCLLKKPVEKEEGIGKNV